MQNNLALTSSAGETPLVHLIMKKIILFASFSFLALIIFSSQFVSGNTGKGKVAVTFTKNVAPIFQKRCEECHRQGGVAPMSLITFEESRPWAKAIREKVVNRTMPPFHATGAIGRYENDPRLTDEEISIITKWVDSGAAKGNPKDLPAAKSWKNDWKNGEPE